MTETRPTLPDIDALLGEMERDNPHGFDARSAFSRVLDGTGITEDSATRDERIWALDSLEWRFGRAGEQPDAASYGLEGQRYRDVLAILERFLDRWKERFGDHYYSARAAGATAEGEHEPWKVAGAILAGIAGAAGYFYLVGGVVTWLRLQALGLPADDLVAVVPRDQLLATGLAAIVVPTIAVAVGMGLLVLTRLSATQFSLAFAALALGLALDQTNLPDGWKYGFAVLVGLLALPLLLGIAIDVWTQLRRLIHGQPPEEIPELGATRVTLSNGVLVVGAVLMALVPLLLFGSPVLVAAVSGTFALSFVAGRWLKDAPSTRARLARGLLIAGVIALAFRTVTEYEPPSPMQPAVVYATSTGACQVPEAAADTSAQTPAGSNKPPQPSEDAPTDRKFEPCTIGGYVVAQTADAVYLATPAKPTIDLKALGADGAEVDGRIVRLPTSAVIETRTRSTTLAVRPEDAKDQARPTIEDVLP